MQTLRRAVFARLASQPDAAEIRARAEALSCHPFNPLEYVVAQLLGRGVLTLAEYESLRTELIARNPYLPAFEIGGLREFGEQWAQQQLRRIAPALLTPTKALVAGYDGEFDLLLPLARGLATGLPEPGARIEVKAVRIARGGPGTLTERALRRGSGEAFSANFAQVKAHCCDVLVLIAVWANDLQYWVIPSAVIASLPGWSDGQHRGNAGEGQIRFSPASLVALEPYAVPAALVQQAIRAAATGDGVVMIRKPSLFDGLP